MTTRQKRDLAIIWTAFIAAGIAAGLLMASCRVPKEGTLSRAISCSTEACRQHCPSLLPQVTKCVSMAAVDAFACLDAIPTMARVAIDVVACVAQKVGTDSAAAARANPADTLSERMAGNAQAWISAKGFSFSP